MSNAPQGADKEQQMDEQQMDTVEEPQGTQTEPDYRALYEVAQAEADKARAEARKWEGRSKQANGKAVSEATAQAQSLAEQLADAKARLADLEAKEERRRVVASVAKDVKLDESVVSMLNGSSADELAEQAKALAEALRAYPVTRDTGEAGGAARPTTAQLFASAINGK